MEPLTLFEIGLVSVLVPLVVLLILHLLANQALPQPHGPYAVLEGPYAAFKQTTNLIVFSSSRWRRTARLPLKYPSAIAMLRFLQWHTQQCMNMIRYRFVFHEFESLLPAQISQDHADTISQKKSST